MAEQRHPRASILRAAQEHLGVGLYDVWFGYIAVGGDASLRQVQWWLMGAAEPDDHDHDLLAQALNDRYVERGLNHPVAYADTPAP